VTIQATSLDGDSGADFGKAHIQPPFNFNPSSRTNGGLGLQRVQDSCGIKTPIVACGCLSIVRRSSWPMIWQAGQTKSSNGVLANRAVPIVGYQGARPPRATRRFHLRISSSASAISGPSARRFASASARNAAARSCAIIRLLKPMAELYREWPGKRQPFSQPPGAR